MSQPVADAAFRPRIAPVRAGKERPLWSVMIPTYDSGKYLADTLRSVLAQDPGPDAMQIEVVDDHSTADDPEHIVREVAGDRVTFHRQPTNVGHIRNFNTCLGRSRGELVHLLHSDDRVLPGFYEVMARPFRDHPDLGCAWCRQIILDDEGRWVHVSSLFQQTSGVIPDWLGKIASWQRLQAPSIVVRRRVYEEVGGFDTRVRAYGEDWEMWVRIASRFAAWHQVEPLAAYRFSRASSLTAKTIRTGLNGRDMRRIIEINRAVLPSDREPRLTAVAREACAMGSLKWAKRMLDAGQLDTPLIQLREALHFAVTPAVLLRAYAVVGYYFLTIARKVTGRRLGL